MIFSLFSSIRHGRCELAEYECAVCHSFRSFPRPICPLSDGKNGAERVSTRTSNKWNANKLISNKLSTFIYDYDLLQQTAHNGRAERLGNIHIYDYTISNAFRNEKWNQMEKKEVFYGRHSFYFVSFHIFLSRSGFQCVEWSGATMRIREHFHWEDFWQTVANA